MTEHRVTDTAKAELVREVGVSRSALRAVYSRWLRDAMFAPGRQKWSQTRLALESGVSRETIYNILNCRVDALDATVAKLAHALSVHPPAGNLIAEHVAAQQAPQAGRERVGRAEIGELREMVARNLGAHYLRVLDGALRAALAHNGALEGEWLKPKPDPLCCYDCGLRYGGSGWMDALVETDVWTRISPTGHDGGILCITCMARRCEVLGLGNVSLRITSGPFVSFTEDEIWEKGIRHGQVQCSNDEAHAWAAGYNACLATQQAPQAETPQRCALCMEHAPHTPGAWVCKECLAVVRGQAPQAGGSETSGADEEAALRRVHVFCERIAKSVTPWEYTVTGQDVDEASAAYLALDGMLYRRGRAATAADRGEEKAAT